MMPTAARLIAALVLAATAWLTSQAVKPYLPEGTDFGWFDYLNVALAVVIGWIVIGRRAGRGLSASVGNGITAAAVLAFWAIFLQAANEMLRLSLNRRYDGPTDAILDVFDMCLEFGTHLIHLDVIGPLLIGGILAGVLSELANRVWR
ncbi:MAG: TrgA family protein [Thalassovita sp.]